MKKTLCVILAFILAVSSLGCLPIAALDYPLVSFESPEEMADYISNNLSTFIEDYNNMASISIETTSVSNDAQVMITGQYFENRFAIEVLETGCPVICLDFNGDNGYLIVDKDSIVKINVVGNIDYLYEYKGTIFFSTIDNTFLYYEDKDYYPFEYEDNFSSVPSSYEGTSNGVITNRSLYIQDRYGEATQVDYHNIDALYTSFITQMSCSVYKRRSQNIIYSEGNCMLVAALNALTCMKKSGKYTALPQPTTYSTVIPTNDPFYNSAINNNYYVANTSVPSLYYQIRQLAIYNYGYTVYNGKNPDGSNSTKAITFDNTVNFIKSVGSIYNQSIDVSKKAATFSNIKAAIEKNVPVIWYFEDNVYGSHAVVINGFTIHKQYKSVLGIQVCTNTINILRISDGWYDCSVYYDFESADGYIFVFN